jgi:hypothetical protein
VASLGPTHSCFWLSQQATGAARDRDATILIEKLVLQSKIYPLIFEKGRMVVGYVRIALSPRTCHNFVTVLQQCLSESKRNARYAGY